MDIRGCALLPALKPIAEKRRKTMSSEKFRRQLRHEIETWRQEGLIDSSMYDTLSDRYQFDEIDRASSNRFTAILMGLGGILMGLGAITFVSANWEEWSRGFRLLLLLGLFLGVNATGFYLWRKPSPANTSRNLGQGLLLLGALILGANMALMSQMFHQSGELYQLFLIWGFGVVLMAFSLRLTSLGILSIILIDLGYLLGLSQVFDRVAVSELRSTILHMPIVVAFLFIPLAYWCRSRTIFSLGMVSVTMALTANLLQLNSVMLEGVFVLPPALLWGYSEQLWQWRSRRPRYEIDPDAETKVKTAIGSFQAISRGWAIVALSAIFYIGSFDRWHSIRRTVLNENVMPLFWALCFDLTILSALAMLGWIQLRFSPDRLQLWRGKVWSRKAIDSGSIALFLIVTFGFTFWHLNVKAIPLILYLVFNVLLFLLSIGLIRDGLLEGRRRTFWGGTILLILGIASRMLEHPTGLLLKSLVFVFCGVGVIVAGLWFEQTLKQTRPRSVDFRL
jgi:uncharacterized membrane protein